VSDYLYRVADQTQALARDADVEANVVALDGTPGMTVSTHAALAAQRAEWWGIALCAVLNVLVQRNHCVLCLDPAAPPTPVIVYVRAGLSFAAATVLIFAGAIWLARTLLGAL
jgi:hypothetical protein